MSDSRPVLIACYLAMLSVGDNSTAVMAALPTMTSDLHLGATTVEWVVNAYLLAAAVFIVLGGDAADKIGARSSSAIGVALFAVASMLIAIGPDAAVVVAARALQGLGAALAVAGTLAAAAQASTESERSGTISAWTAFLMLGFSVGPLVGGAVTHYAGWRVNFWLNVAVMLPAALVLARHRERRPWQSGATDWPGLGILALFMVTLIFGMQALRNIGSAPLAAIASLAVALISLVALVRVERRHPHPLVDFNLFANREFRLAAMLIFLLMLEIMTFLLYYNLFAQAPEGLHLSPVSTGLSLAPMSIALFGFARIAPRCRAAVGQRPMLVAAWLVLAAGCAFVAASQPGTNPVPLMIGLFVVGAGIALPYASAPRIGLDALPQAQAGRGSGLLNSCSFLGGTVGVTFGGIAFAVLGFRGVVGLLALTALLGAAISTRLRGG